MSRAWRFGLLWGLTQPMLGCRVLIWWYLWWTVVLGRQLLTKHRPSSKGWPCKGRWCPQHVWSLLLSPPLCSVHTRSQGYPRQSLTSILLCVICFVLSCEGQWALHFGMTLKSLKHMVFWLWCWMQCCSNKESSYFYWYWWAHGWVWGFWDKVICQPFARWVMSCFEFDPFW